MFYNFTLNTFASVVPSDYEIQNEFDESIVLPVVYDNTSTYAMGGTIALGSLGLTTASGGSILGAAASVVAPILAVVGLVGGALVVGQGLVNIYDYVSNMGLLQSDADALNTSLSLDKKGNIHLQIVPKNSNNEPEPPVKPNSSVYYSIASSLFASSLLGGSENSVSKWNIKYNPDDFVYLNNSGIDTFVGSFKDKILVRSIGSKIQIMNDFRIYKGSSIYRMETASWSNLYPENGAYRYVSNDSGVNFTSCERSSSSCSYLSSTSITNNSNTTYDIYDLISLLGWEILPKSLLPNLLTSSSTQHSQHDFVVDKDIIEKLNPDVQFDPSTGNYVDKNMGTVVNPSDLIVPMPDVMTDTSIEYSPEVEEVIMPNGPTTDPLPNPNPNPDTGTDTGGDSNLLDLLGLIVDAVTNILNFLYELPSHLLNLFQELFVPSSDFFPSKFQNVLTGLTNKVPLFGQIKDFFTNLNLGGEGTPPKITITLPEFFGGETYDFIDFRFFEQYRSYYLNIVRVFMWIFALKHIYRRLPSVISGGGYL